MNNSIKGALWSALVFPGLGQMVLKHYIRGTVIIILVSISMTGIILKAVEDALAILENLDLEGGAISLTTIVQATSETSGSFGGLNYNPLLFFIIGCWIISTVDAYLIGRRIDKDQL